MFNKSLRHHVPAPTSSARQPGPGAWPSQRSPRQKKHPESQKETGASQWAQGKWQTPKGKRQSKPLGRKTHYACQDTSTSLAKTQESLPGAFPCLLTPTTLEGSGRDRDALSVSVALLRLQPRPHLPHQGGSAGSLPITVPVWEEAMLAMRVSWARALFQTRRRQGKM